jgi:hypothetical protein
MPRTDANKLKASLNNLKEEILREAEEARQEQERRITILAEAFRS